MNPDGPDVGAEVGLHHRTEALLRRLVRKRATAGIRKLVSNSRPEDLAAAMEHLTWDEQRRVYALLDDRDYQAEVLAHLSAESAREGHPRADRGDDGGHPGSDAAG